MDTSFCATGLNGKDDIEIWFAKDNALFIEVEEPGDRRASVLISPASAKALLQWLMASITP
jgi:hypothetical protein